MRLIFLIIFLITPVIMHCNQTDSVEITDPCEGPPEPSGQGPPEPSGRRLKTIVADKYTDGSVIIGGTTGAWAFGTYTGIILDREFSYVTPENFGRCHIHPDNTDNWNWAEADAWIDHIAETGQILSMFSPIGPGYSEWAQDDNRTADELETNLRAFMEAVCKRYNGKPGVALMEVVNEAVLNGEWFQNKPGTGVWENPFFIIGSDSDKNRTPLYIRIAFEIANQYAPDVKLLFCNYEGPESTASWELIKETIAYLRDLGLRVDGIGWQAHVDNGWATSSRLDQLGDLIDWAHANDLEFHITEASVELRNGLSEEILEQQAQTYSAILNVLLEKRTSGNVGWNTWYIDDGHGWQIEFYPALFDTSYSAKPAYYAIQKALEEG